MFKHAQKDDDNYYEQLSNNFVKALLKQPENIRYYFSTDESTDKLMEILDPFLKFVYSKRLVSSERYELEKMFFDYSLTLTRNAGNPRCKSLINILLKHLNHEYYIQKVISNLLINEGTNVNIFPILVEYSDEKHLRVHRQNN